MSHSETVAVLLRELGQQLAARRRESWLTQESLGGPAGFSRSTVSVAEIGRQPHAREFWAACVKALDSGGVLAAGCDQIDAVREAEERAAACTAQEARETRALAALTAAQHRADITAGVTAVQPCPHCGSRVAVLTTLMQESVPESAPRRWKESINEQISHQRPASHSRKGVPGGLVIDRRHGPPHCLLAARPGSPGPPPHPVRRVIEMAVRDDVSDVDDFDLDVSIVETGDAASALLCSTDNGCDTQKQGDC